MSDNIPYEIQLEIIKKVIDVKSLIRFRSVSKPWKSFIDSSEFITSYGARNTQPHRLLLKYNKLIYEGFEEITYISFVDDVSFPEQQQDLSPNVPLFIKQLHKSFVIGSSCGLWCFHGYENPEKDMVVIWNPSIRNSVGIVVPYELTYISDLFTHFGFGVCPKTYDPTIVVISLSSWKGKHKVGIFTLSSNTWKMIPTSNTPRESIRLRLADQVATDRFIYWVAGIVGNDGRLESKKLILSFDLITHEFKEVNLPDSIANRDISISKLNESLVVSAYTNVVNDGRVYGVWMMGEVGGVTTSFTKLFNIKTPDLSARTLLGFTMSGEPIMEKKNVYQQYPTLEIYKLCSEQMNDLGIEGKLGPFFVSTYAETLLLVDYSDCCIISNDS